jgi:translation initiation factor 5B
MFQNTSIAIVAASRLVFAVARDGVLPLSKWISKIDSSGQPKHAVVVIYFFAASLLCTILPSQVAFFSLISAGAVPTIAAYGLIALLRLAMTPDNFGSSFFFLGKFRKLFYLSGVMWNAFIVTVSLDQWIWYMIFVLLTLGGIGHDITLLLPRHSSIVQFRGCAVCLRTITLI